MTGANTAGTVDVMHLARVSNDDADVAVRRIGTPKGTRLELEATRTDSRIRLDAVTLECLTWQDRSTFVEFLEPQIRPLSADGLVVRRDPNDDDSLEMTRITNEFGHVEVRTPGSLTPGLLELDAPRLGFTTRLNAVALESITWQDQDTFTELIRRRLED